MSSLFQNDDFNLLRMKILFWIFISEVFRLSFVYLHQAKLSSQHLSSCLWKAFSVTFIKISRNLFSSWVIFVIFFPIWTELIYNFFEFFRIFWYLILICVIFHSFHSLKYHSSYNISPYLWKRILVFVTFYHLG